MIRRLSLSLLYSSSSLDCSVDLFVFFVFDFRVLSHILTGLVQRYYYINKYREGCDCLDIEDRG